MNQNSEHRHIVEQHLGTTDIKSRAARDIVDGIPVAERSADLVFMDERYEIHADRIDAGDRVAARLLRTAAAEIRSLKAERDDLQLDARKARDRYLEAVPTVQALLRIVERQRDIVYAMSNRPGTDGIAMLRDVEQIPRTAYTEEFFETLDAERRRERRMESL